MAVSAISSEKIAPPKLASSYAIIFSSWHRITAKKIIYIYMYMSKYWTNRQDTRTEKDTLIYVMDISELYSHGKSFHSFFFSPFFLPFLTLSHLPSFSFPSFLPFLIPALPSSFPSFLPSLPPSPFLFLFSSFLFSCVPPLSSSYLIIMLSGLLTF